jgi:hypothetical protein
VIDLEFNVEGAEALPFSALPTIVLKLRVKTGAPQRIRSISLNVQVRIAAPARAYTPTEQDRLLDLFGEAERWGQTLKSLLWTLTSVHVPSFSGETVVNLPIPCTYDFEVISTRYFDALEDGHVPLELLFSGTVFYAGDAGLQVEQIAWDKETRFSMPVHVWKDVIGMYFPNTAWLRLSKDMFDRLHQYRMRNTLPDLEAALDRLLEPVWTH